MNSLQVAQWIFLVFQVHLPAKKQNKNFKSTNQFQGKKVEIQT